MEFSVPNFELEGIGERPLTGFVKLGNPGIEGLWAAATARAEEGNPPGNPVPFQRNDATLPEAPGRVPGSTGSPEFTVGSTFTSGRWVMDGIVGSLASRATASRLGLDDGRSFCVS